MNDPREVTAELEDEDFDEESLEDFPPSESEDYCKVRSGAHQWGFLSPIGNEGPVNEIKFCRRCQKFSTRPLIEKIKIIEEAYQAEVNTLQVELLKAGSDLSGYQSDLEHEKTANRQLEEETNKLRNALERHRNDSRGIIYAAKREAAAVEEAERALNALASIVPYLDRAHPPADVVAMYTELAGAAHRFKSNVRRAVPFHSAWSQMDAFGVAQVVIQERLTFLERIRQVRAELDRITLESGDESAPGIATLMAIENIIGMVPYTDE